MDKLKIAFCTDGIFPYEVGGMQRHSRLLIEALSVYSHVHITVLHPHNEEIFSDLPNVTEIHIQGIDEDKIYLFELYKYSKRVDAHLKSLDVDVIYAQGFTVWYNINRYKSRLVINPHGLEPFQGISFKEKTIGFPFRRILKYLFKKARHVVSLGGHLTHILKAHVNSEDQIVVLPNAVSKPSKKTERVIPANKSSDDKIRALFVGRFAPNKGIHILMEAIEELNQEGFENAFEFHLAGKGPLYETYKSSNTLGNVHILGFVSDEELEDLYGNADLFVLPTLFEGMPTVVLEAMSEAIPIIVTDVGATAEMVSSDNGYLIEKNNVSELKNALKKFYALTPDKKKALGAQSLTKIKLNFTWKKVAQKHIELFKKV